MQKEGNNYAFIDSQNLNLAIRDQGWRLDFKRFRVHLKEKYGVKKAFLFIGYVSDNRHLYNALKDFGYEIIFKPTLELNGGIIKGNVDAELVLHTMIEYHNYDKAVIVSGDGDFHCLIDYLIKNNKLCKLLIPNLHAYSRLLKPFIRDKVNFVSNQKDELEYKKSPR